MGWGAYTPISTSSIGTPGDPNKAARDALEKQKLDAMSQQQPSAGGGIRVQGGPQPQSAPAVPNFQTYLNQAASGTATNSSGGVTMPYNAGSTVNGQTVSAGSTPPAASSVSITGAPIAQPQVPASTTVNTAAANPGIDAAVARLTARTQEQQSKEGQVDPFLQESINNLRARQSTDTTQRATEQAVSAARDAAAAINRSKDYELSRRGIAGGGAEGGVRTQIGDAAARAAAKAAAQIQMNELNRQDQLVLGGQGIMSAPSQQQLQRESATNALVAGGPGAAAIPANLALSQQDLGLRSTLGMGQLANDTARTQSGLTLSARDQALQEYEALLRSAGYA